MKNKVAYITGGSKGIGFGVADALMKQGVNVAITSRSQSSADEAVELLKSSNPAAKAIGIEADVRQLASQKNAVDKILKEFGQLDYVIANAGLGHYHSIEDLTEEQWNETIDTNLTGVFFTIKASVDALKKSKGYFITISSLAGTNFFAKGSAYNASKFGLTGFTQAVMLDLRNYGVNVSTIMPGSVATHFNGNTPDESDAWKIQPEDLGELVVDLFKMNPRTLPSKVEVRPSQPSKK
ncbi:SDR family oxidoreductase [Psychroflexus sp. CAK57W]|uniref:SDR family oxidoreductase n=1 Tax=Psychroflexus curvus TaxID=2873595 RepID=UPI001CCEEA3E|nr:SDR family oxidoreductase [Psychroflexus curvus]MBZ9626825.1 SDR family oxidoreductase [Psychroflexus curvus]MBZ9786600.1 SDR family oxidoreductase [Psychroflexus curvus]